MIGGKKNLAVGICLILQNERFEALMVKTIVQDHWSDYYPLAAPAITFVMKVTQSLS